MGDAHFLFFSTLRDRFGSEPHSVALKENASVKEIFCRFFDEPQEAQLYLRSVRFAINGEYVASETTVNGGDEVAVIPPVSGG